MEEHKLLTLKSMCVCYAKHKVTQTIKTLITSNSLSLIQLNICFQILCSYCVYCWLSVWDLTSYSEDAGIQNA